MNRWFLLCPLNPTSKKCLFLGGGLKCKGVNVSVALIPIKNYPKIIDKLLFHACCKILKVLFASLVAYVDLICYFTTLGDWVFHSA